MLASRVDQFLHRVGRSEACHFDDRIWLVSFMDYETMISPSPDNLNLEDLAAVGEGEGTPGIRCCWLGCRERSYRRAIASPCASILNETEPEIRVALATLFLVGSATNLLRRSEEMPSYVCGQMASSYFI
jgi:hypothetical protein